jgi:hypothetical protein
MTTNNKPSNTWTSEAYEILTREGELSVDDRKELYRLFSMAEEYKSLSYRKLRLLALLRCGYDTEEIIPYLHETAKLYPYKPLLYNHFFALGHSDSVRFIFQQIAPKVRCFFWSDNVLTRLMELTQAHKTEISQGRCSHCKAIVPKIVPINYMKIFQLWIHNITKKTGFNDLYNQFESWLNEVINLDYTVVIDGANVGRFIRPDVDTISASDIEHVTKNLIRQGKKPLIVLNECHRDTYQGDTSRVIWSPLHINDDLCWMALALIKPECTFVSNDRCIDWRYTLESSVNNLELFNSSEDFKVWFDTYRRPIQQIKGHIIVNRNKGYSEKYFYGNEHHHLPLPKGGWMCWK